MTTKSKTHNQSAARIELQVSIATALGAEAFKNGILIPSMDPRLAPMLEGPPSAEHVAVLKAWVRAWTIANLSEPIARNERRELDVINLPVETLK